MVKSSAVMLLSSLCLFASVVRSSAADWPTHRGNPQRTGNADGKAGPAAPKVLWAAKGQDHFVAAPLPAGDLVLVNGLGGFNVPTLWAFAADPAAAQRVAWSKSAPLFKLPAVSTPALVDGRPLSHPDLDWAWSAFEDHGVTPVFHVANFPQPFHERWYTGDPDDVAPVLSSVFIWTPPALALADLAVNGVLARHPRLRVGVMELSAIWVPMFLLMLDGGFDFHARFNGRPLHDLDLRPSEYLRRQVRVAAFGFERPDRLIRQAGELFMFCSDFPHAEGLAHPLEDYRGLCGPVEEPAVDRLYGGNVAWLLGASPS